MSSAGAWSGTALGRHVPALLLGLGAGLAVGALAAERYVRGRVRRLEQQLEVERKRVAESAAAGAAAAKKHPDAQSTVAQEHLHWRAGEERRGLGDLLHKVNHIALIVEDIGDALYFYTDIIGFQQIRRPNFDRHGAWLTMGNIELHLIKGHPQTKRGQHPADLIVSHIAIEVHDADVVLQRLKALRQFRHHELVWRQNVSVPKPDNSRANKFESDHTTSDGKVTQFFLEDFDGYWIEICNCDVLTKFCFEQEDGKEPHHLHLSHYSEGCASASVQAHACVDVVVRTHRWVHWALDSLRNQADHAKLAAMLAAQTPVEAERVDAEKLRNLRLRRNTYGDICQGFSDGELRAALAAAGNDVPTAILALKSIRASGQVLCPPAYLENSEVVKETEAFIANVHGRHTQM